MALRPNHGVTRGDHRRQFGYRRHIVDYPRCSAGFHCPASAADRQRALTNMRILQVVTLLSPDGAYGGVARVALNQSAELIGRGHDVTVAAATRGYEVVPEELDGVPV